MESLYNMQPNNTLLANVLGVDVEHLPATLNQGQEILPPMKSAGFSGSILDQDFEDARDKLKDVSDIAQEGLTEISRLALQLGEPRAFDVMAKMISATVAAHKALLEIHKNRQEGKDGSQMPATNVTNNVFLTTAELQKQLSKAADALKQSQ